MERGMHHPIHLFAEVTVSGEKRSSDGQHAAREIATILDLTREAIIASGLDGMIAAWNRSAEQLYGYNASEIIGQHISKIIPPYAKDQCSLIAERVRQGEIIADFETQRVRKDGRAVDVSLRFSPVRDESGIITGVLSFG